MVAGPHALIRAVSVALASIVAEPSAVMWLHVRLADTRTGEILAGVSAPIDSLGPTDADRARAIVDSLAASPVVRRLVSPP